MTERPQLKPLFTPVDKLMEFVGAGALLLFLGYSAYHFVSLPAEVPIHFNAAGEPDRYGHKGVFLILPGIAGLLHVGLTVLSKYPHIFNYPVSITEENAIRQYGFAVRLLRFLKLVIVIVFALIAFTTVRYTQGVATGLGGWFLPAFSAVMFLPLGFYIYYAVKQK